MGTLPSPNVVTAAPGTDTTQTASTAFVTQAVNVLLARIVALEAQVQVLTALVSASSVSSYVAVGYVAPGYVANIVNKYMDDDYISPGYFSNS